MIPGLDLKNRDNLLVMNTLYDTVKGGFDGQVLLIMGFFYCFLAAGRFSLCVSFSPLSGNISSVPMVVFPFVISL